MTIGVAGGDQSMAGLDHVRLQFRLWAPRERQGAPARPQGLDGDYVPAAASGSVLSRSALRPS